MMVKLLLPLLLLLSFKTAWPAPVTDPSGSKSPGLLTMLNLLKGGTNIHSLLKFIKEFKVMGDVLTQLVNASPLVSSIVNEAAEKNPQLQILMKVARGSFPDVKDLYELATHKGDSIFDTLKAASMDNVQWYELQSLWAAKDLFTNPQKLSKAFDLYTGRQLHLKPSLLKELDGGKYTVTTNDVGPDRNLIEMLLFQEENTPLIMKVLDLIGSNPNDLQDVVTELAKMNTSHLTEIMTTGEGNGVTSHSTDPDVLKVMQDVKYLETLKDPKLTTEAGTTLLEIAESVMKVYTRVLQQAGTQNNARTKPDKPNIGGVVG